MIETVLGFAVVFVLGEVVALLVFAQLRKAFDVNPAPDLFSTSEEAPPKTPKTEIFKGVLERLVVTYGLFISLPGILTVFAALKLANRLHHEGDESDRTKNYFLIGNLLTILLCLVYYQIANAFSGEIGSFIRTWLGV